MKADIIKLQKSININFINKHLLLQALTHKSANNKINNEKLEFLGDRVIGLVLAKKLFKLYPNESEGVLDKRLATLVNRKTCYLVGWSIGIQDYIITGNKKKVNNKDNKIISDCCEALIGAVYIDRGFKFTEKFILKIWKKELKKSNITVLDSKTKLQEFSLKLYKKLPLYKFISSSGPKHSPVFKISVSIPGSKEFIGLGSSKQQAQQDGAFILLKNINIK
jgi:ribonuclease III